MTGWRRHTGLAVLLAEDGIDTDQLIPARFMSTPRSEGYGRYLLHDARFDQDGTARPHPLNDVRPSILVAGRNFGSGSSREAAVYALADYGIRAVLAPSFGDIFAGNAVNNGVLPGVIGADLAAALATHLEEPADITVDLDALTVRFGVRSGEFGIDDVWRRKLVNGWDDIDLTQQHADALTDYGRKRRMETDWAWPAEEGRLR